MLAFFLEFFYLFILFLHIVFNMLTTRRSLTGVPRGVVGRIAGTSRDSLLKTEIMCTFTVLVHTCRVLNNDF